VRRKLLIAITILILSVCAWAEPPGSWVDRGEIISNTGSGWDHNFAGYSPATVVKLSGTYYLYYICSDGARAYDDNKPANRALCVATSSDGITNFSKHGSPTPVIQYQPNGHTEEGIFGAAAVVNDSTIYMYYGGTKCKSSGSCTEGTDVLVDVVIRVATSTDGTTFLNHEEVFDHVDNDYENTPFGVVNQSGTANGNAGTWFVYYGREKITGVLYGSSYNSLSKAGDISGVTIGAEWKGVSVVYDSENNEVIMFSDNTVDAWSASLSTLHSFSNEANDPGYENRQGGALLIDGTDWYWYYRSAGWDNDTTDTDTISLYSYSVGPSMSGVGMK